LQHYFHSNLAFDTYTFVNAPPNAAKQALHRDVKLRFGSVAALLPLTNHSALNGALSFCPGSHTGSDKGSRHQRCRCRAQHKYTAEINFGTTVLYDSTCLHHGLSNNRSGPHAVPL
jgi:ectoine hydroxylase-related dioxygenase (phytanoyl-CoA dioxygenase family)